MSGESGPCAPIETFPALREIPRVRHAFLGRVPGLDVTVDRDAAMSRLEAHHHTARRTLRLDEKRFIFGEQVHGAEVALVTADDRAPIAGVDGLVTADPGVVLGVYAADCCAVYLVDPERCVIGLLHSGRKGTEAAIATAAIRRMVSDFGCDPARMVAQLSPCIRPPHYEIDFAAEIRAQCARERVAIVSDAGTCTACHLDRYYSYRAEKGKTGRMLALLSLDAPAK